MDRLIRVRAEVSYIPEDSEPKQNRFLFAYKIFITNEGKEAAQLLSRHWIITNSLGESRDVVGEGVVGLQPVIEPGETFEYSSFCPLETSHGSMRGAYEMQLPSGERFVVEIPSFELMMPRSLRLVH